MSTCCSYIRPSRMSTFENNFDFFEPDAQKNFHTRKSLFKKKRHIAFIGDAHLHSKSHMAFNCKRKYLCDSRQSKYFCTRMRHTVRFGRKSRLNWFLLFCFDVFGLPKAYPSPFPIDRNRHVVSKRYYYTAYVRKIKQPCIERHCFADEKSAALKKSRNTTDGLLIRVSLYIRYREKIHGKL